MDLVHLHKCLANILKSSAITLQGLWNVSQLQYEGQSTQRRTVLSILFSNFF